MHEGDHGIMDHTHEELEKKFGDQNKADCCGHHHHREEEKQSSDLGLKIGAAIAVIVVIGIFIAYRMI
ncbi:MAG: hypothetical protein MJE63_15775 [Proteobacteria bacterium]|nr:hypothetical protein [Pseudomonadota bacterium]